MRMYKEAEEVEEIKESIESTRRAIYNIFSHHHLLKNEADDVFAISNALKKLKENYESVLVQNEIPENIKYEIRG